MPGKESTERRDHYLQKFEEKMTKLNGNNNNDHFILSTKKQRF